MYQAAFDLAPPWHFPDSCSPTRRRLKRAAVGKAALMACTRLCHVRFDSGQLTLVY